MPHQPVRGLLHVPPHPPGVTQKAYESPFVCFVNPAFFVCQSEEHEEEADSTELARVIQLVEEAFERKLKVT